MVNTVRLKMLHGGKVLMTAGAASIALSSLDLHLVCRDELGVEEKAEVADSNEMSFKRIWVFTFLYHP